MGLLGCSAGHSGEEEEVSGLGDGNDHRGPFHKRLCGEAGPPGEDSQFRVMLSLLASGAGGGQDGVS